MVYVARVQNQQFKYTPEMDSTQFLWVPMPQFASDARRHGIQRLIPRFQVVEVRIGDLGTLLSKPFPVLSLRPATSLTANTFTLFSAATLSVQNDSSIICSSSPDSQFGSILVVSGQSNLRARARSNFIGCSFNVQASLGITSTDTISLIDAGDFMLSTNSQLQLNAAKVRAITQDLQMFDCSGMVQLNDDSYWNWDGPSEFVARDGCACTGGAKSRTDANEFVLYAGFHTLLSARIAYLESFAQIRSSEGILSLESSVDVLGTCRLKFGSIAPTNSQGEKKITVHGDNAVLEFMV